MPIPRRISHPAIEAQPIVESGVYRSGPTSLTNLTELDEAFSGLDELEEVHDDDDFDGFPDIPSLMPSVHTEALMAAHMPPPTSTRAQRPLPVFEMELDVPPAPQRPMLRTSSTANMAAVRPPSVAPTPPSPSMETEGRVLESLEDENLDIPLDIKAPPTSHSVITTIAGLEMSAGPPSQGRPAPISSTQKTVDPKPGIVAFAGFGLPPEKLSATPAYAIRVLARKAQLRDDLRVARLRRIQDISLYEAALGCADEAAVTKGVAVIAAGAIGTIIAIVSAAALLL
ncbi:MAG: hypothetical protein U0270_11720 [Labilithrix sp.]